MGDSQVANPGKRFDVLLTNLPFGNTSSTTIAGEEGKVGKERGRVEHGD